MTVPATEALAAARALVEGAKAVPWTSNVLVNRAELLALLARADAAPAEPEPAADTADLEAEREAVLASAREEADAILAQAREEAGALTSESEVVRAADAEAEALRLESHAWVDAHLAEFETGLQRTLEQVETLRDRLAARSRTDDAT